MPHVVVDVMLRPEILDPQGQAVADALPRLGVSTVSSVRVGRRIELEFTEAPEPATLHEIADGLLANPVIEDYTVTVDGQEVPRPAEDAPAASAPSSAAAAPAAPAATAQEAP